MVALLVSLPPLATAAGFTVLDVWRARQPDAALFDTPFAYSLADAIASGDVHRAHQFIKAGQDPNGLIAVRDSVLTQSRDGLVPALLWAVASRNEPAVKMLVGSGARPTETQARAAICLAESLSQHAIAEFLRLHTGGACPEGSASRTASP